MRCDELRLRLSRGAELDAPARDHLGSCPDCRDEHEWLTTLLATRPEPRSARPRSLTGRSRVPALVAAGFLVALAAGYALGHVLREPPAPRIVERVTEKIVTVPAEPTDDQIAVLAIALQSLYRRSVDVDWGEDLTVRRVHLAQSVLDASVCPVSREAARLAQSRAGLFEVR